MHMLAKIIGLLTQPMVWVVAILVIGLWCNRRTPNKTSRWIYSAVALIVLLGWKPLPGMGIAQLERQYPEMAPGQDLSAYQGVVVLGGAMDAGAVAQGRLQPVLNGAAERMTAAAALSRSQPHLKMIFTGGEGSYFGSGPNEAQRAQVFFAAMGVPAQQVTMEDQSRNTYENAVLSARLSGVDVRQKWLLVTSAWHMPRAMATFQKAGWNVTAYPVDFRSTAHVDWTDYNTTGGLECWDLLLHEWIGLLAYRIAGRSQG